MPSLPRGLLTTVAHFVLLLSACLCRADPPTDTEILAKTDAIAAEHLKGPGAVGLSVGVARKGAVIVARAYGLADAEFDVPADKDTMFRIGSVTKQFTAAAVMRLVEQGKISLDDDLGKYLPDFPLQGNTVTILHLLNHTSGIPSYTSLGKEWAKVQPMELTHEEMLALVKDKPFDFKPGEKWSYNNTAYYMLGMVIEKVAGVTYARHLQDEFFTPLNLDRTRYDSNSTLMKNRAQGYALRNGELTNDDPLGMSQPYAAGSLISTGGDLVKWSMALTSGKVVKPESFTQMTTATILPDGQNTHYGFGLEMSEWEGRRCVRHGGGIFGFNSMLMWLPDEDVHIAVISNGEAVKSGRIANDIARAVFGIEKTVAADIPITPDLMKRIVGTYKLDKMDVRIWEEAGKAMLQASAPGQQAFVLQWQGPQVASGNEFRASFDHEVKLVFTDDGRSFTLFQGGGVVNAMRATE
jgi:D-alanyl-D-alanine carboxypeptidase